MLSFGINVSVFLGEKSPVIELLNHMNVLNLSYKMSKPCTLEGEICPTPISSET